MEADDLADGAHTLFRMLVERYQVDSCEAEELDRELCVNHPEEVGSSALLVWCTECGLFIAHNHMASYAVDLMELFAEHNIWHMDRASTAALN